MSLVPADASDIRDAGTETFGDVDRRGFRASLLTVIGGVLFALAALVAVLSAVRLIMRTRKPVTAAERLVGDGAILRGVGRELAAVQRQREDGGWTADLAARALAALRIIGTYAMGRHAAHGGGWRGCQRRRSRERIGVGRPDHGQGRLAEDQERRGLRRGDGAIARRCDRAAEQRPARRRVRIDRGSTVALHRGAVRPADRRRQGIHAR